MDVPATGIPLIPPGFTQPILLEVCIPYGQPAGNYTGSLDVTAAIVAGGGNSKGATRQRLCRVKVPPTLDNDPDHVSAA